LLLFNIFNTWQYVSYHTYSRLFVKIFFFYFFILIAMLLSIFDAVMYFFNHLQMVYSGTRAYTTHFDWLGSIDHFPILKSKIQVKNSKNALYTQNQNQLQLACHYILYFVRDAFKIKRIKINFCMSSIIHFYVACVAHSILFISYLYTDVNVYSKFKWIKSFLFFLFSPKK
jgi:hypothetical protein